jgi:shikimate kinase
MGCGKSSVGRILATKLGFTFADTDQLIVARAGMEIPEIFAARGEEGFREVEADALRSLAGKDRTVVATGGGIVMRPGNVEMLRGLGFVVWLRASEEIIFERVSRNDRRPLLQTENPRATIARLLALRTPLYESAAHVTIDTSRQPHGDIVRQILAAAARFFETPPATAAPEDAAPDEGIADRESPRAGV